MFGPGLSGLLPKYLSLNKSGTPRRCPLSHRNFLWAFSLLLLVCQILWCERPSLPLLQFVFKSSPSPLFVLLPFVHHCLFDIISCFLAPSCHSLLFLLLIEIALSFICVTSVAYTGKWSHVLHSLTLLCKYVMLESILRPGCMQSSCDVRPLSLPLFACKRHVCFIVATRPGSKNFKISFFHNVVPTSISQPCQQ